MAEKNTTKTVKKKAAKKAVKKAAKPKVLTVAGKRKTAIAKATIRAGTGKVKINKRNLEAFNQLKRLYLIEPLVIAQDVLKDDAGKFDIMVNVKGGGMESQIEASRLAIGRALVLFTGNDALKSAYLKYDRSMLVADVRRKEMRKPGDSKARRKRQTSYR